MSDELTNADLIRLPIDELVQIYAARIRLLEQQLSTAREALEPFAKIVEQMDRYYPTWNWRAEDIHIAFGNLDYDGAHNYELVSLADFERPAAVIRSLKD